MYEHQENQEQYQELKTLQEVTSAGGRIVLGQRQGQLCVLKNEPIGSLSLRREERVLNMLAIHGTHPHIVRVRDVFESSQDLSRTLVLDYYAEGDLFKKVETMEPQGGLSKKIGKKIIHELASAIHHTHKYSIAHRDISLENCLVAANGSIVLADFGLAWEIDEGMCDGWVGKELYIAPEAWLGEYDPIAADMWSFGVCIFTALCGVPPVEKAVETDERFRFIVNNQLEDLVKAWGLRPRFENEAMDLVLQLLRVDPSERPNINDVLSHPYFSDCQQTSIARVARVQSDIASRPSLSKLREPEDSSVRHTSSKRSGTASESGSVKSVLTNDHRCKQICRGLPLVISSGTL